MLPTKKTINHQHELKEYKMNFLSISRHALSLPRRKNISIEKKIKNTRDGYIA